MNIIETHDLCKQYGNALRVAHLDLDVPEGSVYGFLGPNGAGKVHYPENDSGLSAPLRRAASGFWERTWTAKTGWPCSGR